jgi:hypothetical protein
MTVIPATNYHDVSLNKNVIQNTTISRNHLESGGIGKETKEISHIIHLAPNLSVSFFDCGGHNNTNNYENNYDNSIQLIIKVRENNNDSKYGKHTEQEKIKITQNKNSKSYK